MLDVTGIPPSPTIRGFPWKIHQLGRNQWKSCGNRPVSGPRWAKLHETWGENFRPGGNVHVFHTFASSPPVVGLGGTRCPPLAVDTPPAPACRLEHARWPPGHFLPVSTPPARTGANWVKCPKLAPRWTENPPRTRLDQVKFGFLLFPITSNLEIDQSRRPNMEKTKRTNRFRGIIGSSPCSLQGNRRDSPEPRWRRR
jgi:hypothetical protein